MFKGNTHTFYSSAERTVQEFELSFSFCYQFDDQLKSCSTFLPDEEFDSCAQLRLKVYFNPLRYRYYIDHFRLISGGCSLPGYLTGDWESSDVGPLTFNQTAFGPYTVGAFGDYYFECYSKVGSKYIVR